MFDLKKFLAMNYSDQWDEIRKYTDWRPSEESFEELAFRLRDKAKELGDYWYTATANVWDYWFEQNSDNISHVSYEMFWLNNSKPIHWIAAALEARSNQ